MNQYILIIATHMIFLLPTTYITLIPTPSDLLYPIKIDPYFTLKYVISCLSIIDIDLGFIILVYYMHTD